MTENGVYLMLCGPTISRIPSILEQRLEISISGGLETVDGPCCGLLGDVPGMVGVQNCVAAAHTGTVCGVAQRYEQFLISALGDYRMGPGTSLALIQIKGKKWKILRSNVRVCVCKQWLIISPKF